VYNDEVLISRRSRFRSGTRFTKRGADATGAVANYAETEQTCLIGNHTILSHVQTRGSIPLRWSSPADVKTYRPRVRIGTDPVAQARALQNHLLSEWNHYVLATPAKHSKFVILNLIDKKKDQGRLGRAFDAVLRAVLDAHANLKVNEVSPKTIEHLWFDFHAEVKGGRWHTLAKLLKQLSPTLAEHGYFKASRDTNSHWKVDRLQGGIVRTNCMDCLDRTNVVQSILGRYALFNELIGMTTSDNEKLLPPEFSNTFRTNALALPWSEGEISHRALWADNADAISRLYAGTPALKRDFTRTGKRTKLGALDDGVNSLQRYYLNNFMDADRQEGVDLMTGYASFTNLRDDDEPNEDTASKFSNPKRANMSLLQAARSILDEQDDGEVLSEASFVHIKKHRKNPLSQMGGPTLDLRWLPGDLQSHMKASANANALQDLDRRTASDAPWWVVDDLADKDEHEELHLPVNIGHLLGGLIAVIQAPVSTATTVLLVLGWMYRENDDE
jgi:SacI homology domain